MTGVPTTFIIDKKGIIQQVHPALVAEVQLDSEVDLAMADGVVRPPNAPPLWQPGSTAFSQLGEEVQIGAYRIRPPLGYVLTKLAEPGRETYRWTGPVRQDGTKPVFEVSITTAPGGQKLEDVLEKDMQAIETPRLGWSCNPAERGEIKGLIFVRTRWSIMEPFGRLKGTGLEYVAQEGDRLIRISNRDLLPTYNGAPDGAAMTFHKAVK